MANPYLEAARDVANSPSGWAKQCIAAGLKPRGSDVFFDVSRLAVTNRVRPYIYSEDGRRKVDIIHIHQDARLDLVTLICSLIVIESKIESARR
jgi:hypothetical protein